MLCASARRAYTWDPEDTLHPLLSTSAKFQLGWHLCRTKLPRMLILNCKPNFETKSLRNAPTRPRKFLSPVHSFASPNSNTISSAISNFLRSEKLQNESFPNFSNFRPEFCPEFSPNLSRTFRASFRGRRRPEKIHQKSLPAIFQRKIRRQTRKKYSQNSSGEQAE